MTETPDTNTHDTNAATLNMPENAHDRYHPTGDITLGSDRLTQPESYMKAIGFSGNITRAMNEPVTGTLPPDTDQHDQRTLAAALLIVMQGPTRDIVLARTKVAVATRETRSKTSTSTTIPTTRVGY
jgi:hypothetical protein